MNFAELYRGHPDKFKLAGSVVLDRCPVCFGSDHPTVWLLPQKSLGAGTFLSSPGRPFHNTYLAYLPMLTTPQEIYAFDMCQECQAIFLNPKHDDHASYARDASKVRAFREYGIDPWRSATDNYMKDAPFETKTVLDAACGAGQMLAVLRDRNPDLRLIGLELSRPSVEFISGELGIEAHIADLDNDDMDRFVLPGTVDFVIFNESYEHVRNPTTTLRRLVRTLRPGGRIRFSAQAYGPEFDLQIRVGEPIFISAATLDWTIKNTATKLVNFVAAGKMYVTLEKL